SLPRKKERKEPERIRQTLLVIRRDGKLLLGQGGRVKGFWDLPQLFEGARLGVKVGTFQHSILDTRYTCDVHEGLLTTSAVPKGFVWWSLETVEEIPLSTAAKKALRCLDKSGL